MQEGGGAKLRLQRQTGHVNDENYLKESDSIVSLICEDSMNQLVDRRKRQRTNGMKIYRRRMQEHQEEKKKITDKTDEDKERRKDLEPEICVVTWNVNKSSAQ